MSEREFGQGEICWVNITSGRTPGHEHEPPAAPHWATYFRAADVDAAAAETLAAGGSVYVPPHVVASGRGARSCALASPQCVASRLIGMRS